MISDTAFVAIVVGLLTTVATLLGSIYASRKWGLPGLAREVERQREDYIEALEKNNGRLEAENAQVKTDLEAERTRLRAELRQMAAMNDRLAADNRELRAKLAVAYEDIADLYRRVGERVPTHVTENASELAIEPETT